MSFARTFVLGSSVAFQRTQADQASTGLRVDQVSYETISSAISNWGNGDPTYAARLFDLILVHPYVSGVREQLEAAVLQLPLEITAADDSPESQAIADELATEWEASGAHRENLIRSCFDGVCRGGGLTELLWKLADGQYRWDGVKAVPQSRVRFDRNTGAIAFALRPSDLYGIPASAFPLGTFVAVTPDEERLDFSKRGLDRKVISDWYALVNSSGWWSQDLENYGIPMLIGEYSDPGQEAALRKAFQTMGANPRLLKPKGAVIQIEERTVQNSSPFGIFQDKRERFISIAYLGSTQTVQVKVDEASAKSVGIHSEVRNEKVEAIARLTREAIERDFFRAWVVLRHGIENLHRTPRLSVPKRKEAAGQVLDELQKAKNIGLPVEAKWAYDRLGWPMPKGVPEILFGAQADPEPAQVPAPLKAVA